MTDFAFAWPDYWPWLGLLPLAGGLSMWAWARARAHAAASVGPRLVAVAGRPAHRRLAAACALLAWFGVAVALLRPVTWDGDAEVGPDVVLCVDVSRTMAARDVEPTRLGAVQAAIATLAAQVRSGRLGLVAFAGTARLVVPLTDDAAAMAQLANDLQPGDLGGGTHPAAAIELATGMLLRSGRGGDIVLLGDGEDFPGAAPAAAAAAAARGLAVHTLGVGDERGSKVVAATTGGETFLRDRDGVDVITRRESAQLAAIARAGGGADRVLAGADALAALHRQVLVGRAARVALRHGELVPTQRFTWPLLAALSFWTLRALLPRRRR